MKLFSVYDVKSSSYLKLFCAPTVASASREFEIAANEGDSMISKFPGDFRLDCLGEFEPRSGTITTFEGPQIIGTAMEFQRARGAQLPLDSALANG